MLLISGRIASHRSKCGDPEKLGGPVSGNRTNRLNSSGLNFGDQPMRPIYPPETDWTAQSAQAWLRCVFT